MIHSEDILKVRKERGEENKHHTTTLTHTNTGPNNLIGNTYKRFFSFFLRFYLTKLLGHVQPGRNISLHLIRSCLNVKSAKALKLTASEVN